MNVIKAISKIPRIYPRLKGLYWELSQFRKNSCFPAGHYYSPIISVNDVRSRQQEIWKNVECDGIEGIDLNTSAQIELLNEFSKYYNEIPFPLEKSEGHRYYFENEYYSYTDAIALYSVIRHFRPANIIEAGSGFSSALMLDTNEKFFANSINLTFIEPYPDRLFSLLSSSDKERVDIKQTDLQSVPLDEFRKLNEGDILFIDSTHVAKTGSDVNFILFELLPVLKSGVLIHFHDVFYPFEYPKEWVFIGRNWNEDYFLRAFLMHNDKYKILLFSHYIHTHHSSAFAGMPLSYKNTGGNLWLKKL